MRYVDGIIGLFVERRTPGSGMGVTAANRNVRPYENIPYNDAPEPQRESDFNSRPARYPKFISLNIADIQAVMEDEFGYSLFAPAHSASFSTDGGGMLPFQEGSNIVSPLSAPYGSKAVIDPEQYYYPLMGG